MVVSISEQQQQQQQRRASPRHQKKNDEAFIVQNSFTADSPYFYAFCEKECGSINTMSETLKEIASKTQTMGKCGALMAEATRRLAVSCRLQQLDNVSPPSEWTAEQVEHWRAQQMKQRRDAMGDEVVCVLSVFAEVLDEIADAQVQMCETLEASLGVALKSFAESEGQAISSLKQDVGNVADASEQMWSKYLHSRHHAACSDNGGDLWNRLCDQMAVNTGVASGVTTPPGSANSSNALSNLAANMAAVGSNASSPTNSLSARATEKVTTAANLQMTMEQLRLVHATAEWKRFQLLKHVVELKHRRNFDMGESMLAGLHGIRAYFSHCSDLVTGLAPRMGRFQQTQTQLRQWYAKELAPLWKTREHAMSEAVRDMHQATIRSTKNMEWIVTGDTKCMQQQVISLRELEQEVPIWDLPYTLAKASLYQRDPTPGVLIEGYLYRRASTRLPLGQAPWTKRWYMMDRQAIFYFPNPNEMKKGANNNANNNQDYYRASLERVKVCDVVLCTVRDLHNSNKNSNTNINNVRFCFEVVAANQKPMLLQARGPKEHAMWVNGIRAAIERQLVHGNHKEIMTSLNNNNNSSSNNTDQQQKQPYPMSRRKSTSDIIPSEMQANPPISKSGSMDMSMKASLSSADLMPLSDHIPVPEFHYQNNSDIASQDQEQSSSLQQQKQDDEAFSSPSISRTIAASPPNPPPLSPQSPASGRSLVVRKLMHANPTCADCNCPAPDWASLNLGVLMCIECSAVHRSLGVHVSKVRSLMLDSLSDSEGRLLLSLGNENVNVFWEGATQSQKGWKKPTKRDSRKTKEDWIKGKYLWKGFMKYSAEDGSTPAERQETFSLQLYQAAKDGKVLDAARALAFGGSVEWKNPKEGGKTPLHICALGKEDKHVECAELLLQNGAKIDMLDYASHSVLDGALVGNAERHMVEFLTSKL